MKLIEIYTGDTDVNKIFERGLHPENQIKAVISLLNTNLKIQHFSINTNSPFVAEAFNKFGKQKSYKIKFYFENKEVNSEYCFNKFSKPFENLIFGEEEKKRLEKKK